MDPFLLVVGQLRHLQRRPLCPYSNCCSLRRLGLGLEPGLGVLHRVGDAEVVLAATNLEVLRRVGDAEDRLVAVEGLACIFSGFALSWRSFILEAISCRQGQRLHGVHDNQHSLLGHGHPHHSSNTQGVFSFNSTRCGGNVDSGSTWWVSRYKGDIKVLHGQYPSQGQLSPVCRRGWNFTSTLAQQCQR